MKINKTTAAFLLLVLISFNIVISNCEQIKYTKGRKIRSSYKRSQIKRSYSKSKTNNVILDTIKGVLQDPKNIIYFCMGVAAEFMSNVENIYKKIKSLINKFEPCYDTAKLAFTKNEERKEQEALAELRKLDSIKLLEEKLAKKENQKEYCEKTKEEIGQNFMRATWESEPNRGGLYGDIVKLTPDFILSLSYSIAKNVVTKDEFCYRPTNTRLAPKTAEALKRNFSSLDEYYKECMFFNNLDCDIFSPETSKTWAVIKKAWGYYGMVQDIGSCISNLFTKPDADKDLSSIEGAKDIFKEGGFFYKALATVVGVVANVLTLGAWGGIKGGYYLIQLALDIKKFYDEKTEDLGFRLGKLIGKAIAIAKSFLFGRKKIRKMK